MVAFAYQEKKTLSWNSYNIIITQYAHISCVKAATGYQFLLHSANICESAIITWQVTFKLKVEEGCDLSLMTFLIRDHS